MKTEPKVFVVDDDTDLLSAMVEVIEAIYWFGTEHNVKFSEKSSSRIAWAQKWRASHAQSAR